MGDFIIQSIALAAFAAAAIAKFIQYVSEAWLRDTEKQQLQDRFETWWLRVSYLSQRELILAIARKTSDMLEAYFGKKLLSRHSFNRSLAISTALLSSTLLLFGFIAKDHSLVTPWEKWHEAMTIIKKVESSEKLDAAKPEVNEFQQKLAKMAEQLDTVTCAALFSVVFYPFLFFGNATGFYYTVSFLRRLLRTLSRTDDALMAIGLFVFTGFLTLFTTTSCIFVVGVVADPALWILAIGVIMIASLSFSLALWAIFAVSFFTWVFASPTLITLAIIVSSPLFIGGVIIGFALLALWMPKLFHRAIGRVLLLCAEKGPAAVFAALLGAIAFALAVIVRVLS